MQLRRSFEQINSLRIKSKPVSQDGGVSSHTKNVLARVVITVLAGSCETMQSFQASNFEFYGASLDLLFKTQRVIGQVVSQGFRSKRIAHAQQQFTRIDRL